MGVTLVVGATGQLGTAVVRRARAAGREVRALIRPTSDHAHLRSCGVELCYGDLRDRDSLSAACSGATEVIATATVVFPRGGYSFERDEGVGYRDLLRACREQGVAQFLFTSTLRFPEPYVSRVPTLRLKRTIEQLARESEIPYTIVRAGPFMDDYFALMGSDIPLRGVEAPTLRRPFWFSRLYMRFARGLIEGSGIALVPGRADARHSFVALDDVAAFLVSAAGRSDAANACFDLGGPENLSWSEVAALYAELLERPVRALSPVPSAVLRLAARMLQPFSEAAANHLGILWTLAENNTTVSSMAAETFGVRLTSAEEFLRDKLSA